MANSYFDCTKTADFQYELRRMCKTYSDCNSDEECYNDKLNEVCPMFDWFDESGVCDTERIPHLSKKQFLTMTAEVQQWSDTHPATETELIKQGKIPASNYLNCTNCSSACDEISW